MAKVGTYLDNQIYNMIWTQCTIASGQTVSDAVDLRGLDMLAFILPAAFTGTTIQFQMSPTAIDGTYYPCYNIADAVMEATVTQGRAYFIEPQDLAGIRFIKLVSGSAEAAERTILIGTREVS